MQGELAPFSEIGLTIGLSVKKRPRRVSLNMYEYDQ